MRINRSIISNQTESVPVVRTLTINGTTYDLTANRTWTVSGGGITGSGTTNYLSKWTSGTALGNSLVFDDGNFVGVGTNSPNTRLSIVSSGAGVFAARFTDGFRADLVVSFPESQFAGLDSYFGTSGGGFIFRNGTSEAMRLSTNGRLLINTTSDVGTLMNINGAITVGGMINITGSTGLPIKTDIYLRFASGFSSPDIGRMYIGDGTGWKFHISKRISSTTTDLITFVDNGSVVIGTPGAFIDYKLEVMGATKVNGGELLVDAGSTIASNLYGTGQVLSGSSAQPTLFLDTTWNTTGNPSAIELNVTNTASGSTSKVMNLKVNSTSVFIVSKGGAIQTTEPTGYTAKPWKLGDAMSGTITPDYYIKVEIDGQIYSIPALLGTP